MTGYSNDAAPLHGQIRDMRAAYPAWAFAIIRSHAGPRIQAHRPDNSPGLYAVITDDVAELRRELDNTAPKRQAAS